MTALSTDKLEARDLRNLDHILRDPLSGLTWDNRIMAADAIREVLAHRKAEAGMRALLLAGCDLLADEYDSLKSSISMPDGSLSPNDLDKWAVEKVAAMDDWIASVKATLYPTTPEAEGGSDA